MTPCHYTTQWCIAGDTNWLYHHEQTVQCNANDTRDAHTHRNRRKNNRYCTTRTNRYLLGKNELRNPYTLNDIKTLESTLTTVLNKNIFTPTGREKPVDVPGNGKLAEQAQKLRKELQAILTDWNYSET